MVRTTKRLKEVLLSLTKDLGKKAVLQDSSKQHHTGVYLYLRRNPFQGEGCFYQEDGASRIFIGSIV